MEKLKLLIDISTKNNDILKIKISGKESLVGKPLDAEKFSFERVVNNQAFHKTIKNDELYSFLSECLSLKNNVTIYCNDYIHSFKLSKAGKLLTNKESNTSNSIKRTREKFFLPLDIPVFKKIGLVSNDGKIIEKMRAKYEQIKRFCELVVDEISNKNEISIIDCGCGKAYLSFALYHYLTYVKNMSCKIHGTDLKEDVINELRKLAKEYKYEGLTFSNTDIKTADLSGFDMMISLHACDKATDFAIFNSIKGGVDTILSVPCCQQEMNATLHSTNLPIISQYGLIKERVSALLTDAVRASILTAFSYKVKVVELMDFEHSPKNLMIKAKKANVTLKTRKKAFNDAETFLKEFNTSCELFTMAKTFFYEELT